MAFNQNRIDRGLYWDRALSVVSGCSPISEGCDHCWAAQEAHMRENNPNAKEPNWQVWAKQVDLMLRRDNRSAEDIRAVIDWCQDDEFWKVNILSPQSLRKQFDRLYMKLNANPLRGVVSDVTARTIKNLQNLDLD